MYLQPRCLYMVSPVKEPSIYSIQRTVLLREGVGKFPRGNLTMQTDFESIFSCQPTFYPTFRGNWCLQFLNFCGSGFCDVLGFPHDQLGIQLCHLVSQSPLFHWLYSFQNFVADVFLYVVCRLSFKKTLYVSFQWLLRREQNSICMFSLLSLMILFKLPHPVFNILKQSNILWTNNIITLSQGTLNPLEN